MKHEQIPLFYLQEQLGAKKKVLLCLAGGFQRGNRERKYILSYISIFRNDSLCS